MKVILDENAVLPDDMTQEELDELLLIMQKMADSGELFENSEFVDIDSLTDEEKEAIFPTEKRIKH